MLTWAQFLRKNEKFFNYEYQSRRVMVSYHKQVPETDQVYLTSVCVCILQNESKYQIEITVSCGNN